MAVFNPGRYLASFFNYEKHLRDFSPRLDNAFFLERVRHVLHACHDPHLKLKVIHIAGSKGKGSTAAMVAEILRQAGYRVGLYTSPHLYDVRERIRILTPQSSRQRTEKGLLFDDCLSQKEFSSTLRRLRPVLDTAKHHPIYGRLTYFEVLTILAFQVFFDQKVDFVILETGLGGRLDATNVCQPWIAVITPISLEHIQQLGSTIKAIAGEKAGIIKCTKGSLKPVVVLAPQVKAAQQVLDKHCRSLKIRPIIADLKRLASISSLALFGPHQRINAATALTVIDALKKQKVVIDDKASQRGLRKTFWPGRFEILGQEPTVIMDGAHNPESARQLILTLREYQPNAVKENLVLIFGASDDKDIQGMGKILSPHFGQIYLTAAKHPRAYQWDEKSMKKYFHHQSVQCCSSVALACRQAWRSSHRQTIIVVCGSLFLAAEARRWFLNRGMYGTGNR